MLAPLYIFQESAAKFNRVLPERVQARVMTVHREMVLLSAEGAVRGQQQIRRGAPTTTGNAEERVQVDYWCRGGIPGVLEEYLFNIYASCLSL